MISRNFDVLVIGGGGAGLAAGEKIAENGFSVAVVDRENCLGGILNQCIHNGFGVHEYGEDLTGPEYAQRCVEGVGKRKNIEVFLETTINHTEETPNEMVLYGFSRSRGIIRFSTRALVLAMGCRERNRGNIGIPGTRPAGIFTAGLAQRLVNIDGYVPGKEVVLVGSGDIGLIMARRMTWVGSKVLAVVEIQPYPSGLARNIAQCIDDFDIPLYLSHVISRIRGKDRVEGVDVTPLDNGTPDYDETFTLQCDTLLLSVGLIPDNELSKKLGVELNPQTGGPVVDADLMTSRPGIFACGNVLHVHDLVDSVSAEARRCGTSVSRYLREEESGEQGDTVAGSNIRYIIPGKFRPGREMVFTMRPLIVKNKAELKISQGKKPVCTRRLLHVQPSEMISITVDLDGAEAKRGPLEFHLH